MSEINKRIEALEAELQKLKNEVTPKFEVGKWYKTNCLGGSIFYLTESPVEDHYVSGYGFENGDWCDLSEHYWTLEQKYKPTLATHQEVEEALKRQAIKMGFKEGVRFKTVERKGIVESYESKFEFDKMNVCIYPNETVLLNNGLSCIFCNGVWAEIIKDEPIKIGGYEVKFDHKGKASESIIIGCKAIGRTRLESLRDLMAVNRFKKVSFDGVETEFETINKILAI